MSHEKDKEMVVRWARRKMASKDWVVLDTETTGLGDKDEIIQIAIVDHDGKTLLDTLVKPVRKSIPKDATAIHGIKIQHLDNAPTIIDLFPKIKKICKGKTIITYNAAYDSRLLQQSLLKHKKDVGSFKIPFECAMINFATYKGEPGRNGEYKWHKLEGGDHSALGDSLACHRLLKSIADDDMRTPPIPWWKERWKPLVLTAIVIFLYCAMLAGQSPK